MKRLVFVALSIVCMAPTVAVRADEGFYLGIEGGQGRTQFDFEATFVPDETYADREDTMQGVYGGYTFTKHFGFELAYADLGTTSFTYVRNLTFPQVSPHPPRDVELVSRSSFEAALVAMSLLGRYELGRGVSLTGRFGLAQHRLDAHRRTTEIGPPPATPPITAPSGGGVRGEDTYRQVAYVFGIGIEWNVHRHWALRLQAQQYVIDGDEEFDAIRRDSVTTLTGGVEYRF